MSNLPDEIAVFCAHVGTTGTYPEIITVDGTQIYFLKLGTPIPEQSSIVILKRTNETVEWWPSKMDPLYLWEVKQS